jgi:hypothetical protein
MHLQVEQHTGEAITLAERLEGKDGPTAATCYHLLAMCLCVWEQWDEWEEILCRPALTPAQLTHLVHPRSVNTPNNLYRSRPLMDKALEIRRKQLGDHHPHTLESMSAKAAVSGGPALDPETQRAEPY